MADVQAAKPVYTPISVSRLLAAEGYATDRDGLYVPCVVVSLAAVYNSSRLALVSEQFPVLRILNPELKAGIRCSLSC